MIDAPGDFAIAAMSFARSPRQRHVREMLARIKRHAGAFESGAKCRDEVAQRPIGARSHPDELLTATMFATLEYQFDGRLRKIVRDLGGALDLPGFERAQETQSEVKRGCRDPA